MGHRGLAMCYMHYLNPHIILLTLTKLRWYAAFELKGEMCGGHKTSVSSAKQEC